MPPKPTKVLARWHHVLEIVGFSWEGLWEARFGPNQHGTLESCISVGTQPFAINLDAKTIYTSRPETGTNLFFGAATPTTPKMRDNAWHRRFVEKSWGHFAELSREILSKKYLFSVRKPFLWSFLKKLTDWIFKENSLSMWCVTFSFFIQELSRNHCGAFMG